MYRNLALAIAALAGSFSHKAGAAPTGHHDDTIYTNGLIVINQIVSTVTVAGCDASPLPIGDANRQTSVSNSGSNIFSGTAGQSFHAGGAGNNVAHSPDDISAGSIYGQSTTSGSSSNAHGGGPAPPARLSDQPGYQAGGASSIVLTPTQPRHETPPAPDHIVPQPSATLHFSSPPVDGSHPQASTAVMYIPQLVYPAVNAFTASGVKSVVCNGNQATVNFASPEVYGAAAQAWPNAGMFTLITFSDTCGTGLDDGMHDFLLVKNIIAQLPGSQALIVNIENINLELAVGVNTTITVQIDSTPASGNNGTSAGNDTTPASCSSGAFDQALDDASGDTLDLTNPVHWAQVLPGVEEVTSADIDALNNLPALSRRGLSGSSLQRRWGWPSWFPTLPKIEIPSPSQIWESVKQTASDVVQKLDDWTSFSPSLDKDVNFSEYAPNNAVSDAYGSAFQIYDNGQLKAYCIGCGVEGSFRISAVLQFSISSGITAGKVTANGSMRGAVVFGLDGQASITVPLPEQTIAEVTLGDLLLPGILKLGPSARIGAGGSVNFDARGLLKAGATLSWPDVSANIDVLGSSNNAITGWEPSIEPVFQANGSVSVTLDAHLTAAIGFTIGILDDKFSKSVELVDQPGVKVTAGAQGSVFFNDGSFSGGFEGDCSGVAVSAQIYNDLYADIAGLQRYDLFDWISDPYSYCFNIPLKRGLDQRDHRLQELPVRPRYRRQVPSNSTSANATTTSIASSQASFAIIHTEDGDFQLHWSENGNIYARSSDDDPSKVATASDEDVDISTADQSGFFGTLRENNATKPIIIGDIKGRALHAYSDELQTYGVSRLRIHDPNSMPPKSLLVALASVSDPDGGEDVLAAVDTTGAAYYPVLCAYPDCFPKVFLARDPVAGATTLENLTAITGTSGLRCSFVRLDGNADTQGF